MANAPSILVVDGEPGERTLIAAVLREAGFAVVEAAEARGAWAAMSRQRFAAAVAALPDGEGIEFRRQARCRQPDLAAIVVGATALRLVDKDCGMLIGRPLDPRQLLGCVFELVLREGEQASEEATGPYRSDAAELGIAAAELACLDSRRLTAAASGASRLVHDLTRQIGETRALYRGFAAAMTAGSLAVAGGPAD